MRKCDIIDFFDRCAPTWDAEMIKNDSIIETILDNDGFSPGMDVLDVACGTGVMFPYYQKRGVNSIVGVHPCSAWKEIGLEPVIDLFANR